MPNSVGKFNDFETQFGWDPKSNLDIYGSEISSVKTGT
jgi:hypothetical protein